MKQIAHRGNTRGPNPERENTIDYIEEAIQQGYDVEIDIHLNKGIIYLGHDKPEHEVSFRWLLKFKDYLWCHAKDILAFRILLDLDMHTFMHDGDPVALTSKGYLWTNPGEILVPNSIAVMPDPAWLGSIDNVGICSDYMEKYNE